MRQILFKSLYIALILALIVPFYAVAQIQEPDAGFEINQVEAYRNVLELNDQLYIFTATINYNTTPTVYNVTESYILTLRTAAGVILGSSTFYTYYNNGYGYGLASLYFDSASAPVWNQPYVIHLQGNPSLHWLDTSVTHTIDKAYYYDHSALTYTDETTDVNDAGANDVTLPPDAMGAENDAFYIGAEGMFNNVEVNLGTNGNWTGTYVWEYWDGDEWVEVSGLSDGTTGFTAGVGIHNVTYTCPTDWQRTTVNGEDYYWLRYRIVSVTAHVVQPLGTQFWNNMMDDPPEIQTNVISLWYDDGTIAGTSDRLTTRLRSLASSLENSWGLPYDLVETIGGVQKLTSEGEEYFENSIANLRVICPDLFADVLSTPDFPEKYYTSDFFMGGDDADVDVYGANNIYAQTFTAGDSYPATGFWIKAFIVGLPGVITGSLRETLAGVPTGADLVSGTIDADDFTTVTHGEWYEISFTDDYDLTAGTVYALVLSAPAGNVANYVSWRVDTAGGYAGGQECFYNGAVWAAVAANDLMFSVTAFDAYSMSYRNRLANRLVGTRFDMTSLATNLGMSRMWLSTIFWFIFSLLIAIGATRRTGSFKLTTLVFLFLLPFGALIGFIYLEVAVIAFFGCIFLVVQQLIFSRSP